MAYLNIQGLLDGKFYTTTYINGAGEEVSLYAYVDGAKDIRVTRDKNLVGGGKSLKSSVIQLDTWEEYIPEKKVYLTDKGLEVMKLSSVAFNIKDKEDYNLLMEAIENSTDLTWNHGDKPTAWGSFSEYILINESYGGNKQAIYWGIYSKNESSPTFDLGKSKGWLFKYE